MARRSFGNLRKLPSGRWQASYTDDITGKRIAAPATFGTKAAAALWLSTIETDRARGHAEPRQLIYSLRRPGLADGCSEVSVTDPVSRLEVDLMPDAGQFLRLALPLVAAVGLWLAALVVWTSQTKDEPGKRPVWPMVASNGVSLAAAFFVYARAEYTGFELAWGLADPPPENGTRSDPIAGLTWWFVWWSGPASIR